MERCLGTMLGTLHADEDTWGEANDETIFANFGREHVSPNFGSNGTRMEWQHLDVHYTVELEFPGKLLGSVDLHTFTVGIS